MEIKIYRFNSFENSESNTKAFVDIIIDNEVIVKGFKLIEGKEGLFLGNPSEKSKNEKYYDTVRFQTIETKKEVEQLAIAKYNDLKLKKTENKMDIPTLEV